MRKIVVILIAALCLASGAVSKGYAGSYQGPGNFVGSPSPQVTAIFAAFPQGGEGLTNAIRELLINNPDLADDVAFVASNAGPAQQGAAAVGMAQAAVVLIARGNSGAGATIVAAAVSSGNATLTTTVSSAVAQGNGTGSLYGSGANSNPTTTSCTTTSPTTPGNTC
jgi:hypothetical protein